MPTLETLLFTRTVHTSRKNVPKKLIHPNSCKIARGAGFGDIALPMNNARLSQERNRLKASQKEQRRMTIIISYIVRDIITHDYEMKKQVAALPTNVHEIAEPFMRKSLAVVRRG